MEDIYSLKGVPGVCEEPLDLKEYFERYAHALAASPLQGSRLGTQEALRKCFPPPPPDGTEDLFDLEKLEAACSPDLLTVRDELGPGTAQLPAKKSGRFHNWYTGSFKDMYIPEGGKDTLHTLASLAEEHSRRKNIADYAQLRNRNLKYFNTLRLVENSGGSPDPPVGAKEGLPENLNEIVINVRVHRPFHKRMYGNKFQSTFPKHSQELLLLGSQKLTELRDSIVCINTLAVGQDLSPLPEYKHIKYIPTAVTEFPSSFIYINGVFYNDMRHPSAKDYSEVIRKWAQKRSEIGPLVTKRMEDTCLRDLKLRLGYPYVFLHVGNCEHIVVFTDARMLHKSDVQNPAHYPVSWGQPRKLSARCQLCYLNLANWIAKGDPRLPLEYSLLCQRCLKAFCYDKYGKKEHTLRVYPFMDEFVQQQRTYEVL